MKKRTEGQLAKLGLVMMSLDFPAGTTGYAELFTAAQISEVNETDWLKRVSELNPGKNVVEDYKKALGENVKSLVVKTVCSNDGSLPRTSLAPPTAEPGDNHDKSIQIRRIVNIPAEVDINTVIRVFERTTDITGLGGKKQRLEFDWSELGEGKIIR